MWVYIKFENQNERGDEVCVAVPGEQRDAAVGAAGEGGDGGLAARGGGRDEGAGENHQQGAEREGDEREEAEGHPGRQAECEEEAQDLRKASGVSDVVRRARRRLRRSWRSS